MHSRRWMRLSDVLRMRADWPDHRLNLGARDASRTKQYRTSRLPATAPSIQCQLYTRRHRECNRPTAETLANMLSSRWRELRKSIGAGRGDGSRAASINARATGCDGMRTPTVSRPAVTRRERQTASSAPASAVRARTSAPEPAQSRRPFGNDRPASSPCC